jgi:NTE family protein
MGFFRQFSKIFGKEIPIGLALSGGATHGAAHIGVLQVLEREGIQPAFMAGTSAGALIGAAYCSGIPLEEIQQLFLKLEWPDLLKFTLRPKLSFFDAQPMENFLKTVIGELTFEELKIPFSVVACDLNTGEKVVLNKGPLGSAIRASSAFPALFPPVQMGDRLLVDGGILDNLPVEEVRAMGAQFIIASDVSRRGRIVKPPENPIDILTASIYLMQARSAYCSADECDCYIRPDMGNSSGWGFKETLNTIESGRIAAERKLPEIKEKLKNKSSLSLKSWLRK